MCHQVWHNQPTHDNPNKTVFIISYTKFTRICWLESPLFSVLLVTFAPITVYPKKYAHGFVVLCFVVVMQSFIMNSHEVFIHIHQGCFAGTGTIVRLPQCQWSKPDGYGKISQCITTTKHSKAKTVCIFLGIYCNHDNIYICFPLADNIILCCHCSLKASLKAEGKYRYMNITGLFGNTKRKLLLWSPVFILMITWINCARMCLSSKILFSIYK